MLKSIRSQKLLETLEGIKVKPANMLAALGGVLILAYIVVGAAYAKERSAQSDFREQVEAGGGTLSGVGDPQLTLTELQDRLTYLEADLAALQNSFPTKLDSTAIVQGLVDYANQSRVSIKQMNALPIAQVKTQKEGDVAYSVLRYTLIIEGALPDMLAFLSRLEEATAQTAALGDVTVTNGPASQMTVGVSFYSRPETTTNAAGAATTPSPETAPSTARSKN
ncbi:MAG: hypothetical protein IMZ46_05195 [Acidobacteria bacterium]|nr:hypothetical protein [Acidobacteriota bacterium]